MDSIPNEILTYLFLFVRGHTTSGALADSRLVCRHWRDVIDANVDISKPCSPYREAHIWGYLTPAGVMPDVGDVHYEWVRDAGRVAARLQNAHLLRWLARRFPDVKFYSLDSLLILCGVWDDASPNTLTYYEVHPLDLPRLRTLGQGLVNPQKLGEMFNSVNLKHPAAHFFAQWTDAELGDAWGYLIARYKSGALDNRMGLKLKTDTFLLISERGLLREGDISTCLRAGVYLRDVPLVDTISAVALSHDWRCVLPNDALRTIGREPGRPMLERLAQPCDPVEWHWETITGTNCRFGSMRHITAVENFVKQWQALRFASPTELLDWLLERRFFVSRPPTADDMLYREKGAPADPNTRLNEAMRHADFDEDVKREVLAWCARALTPRDARVRR